ncbi:hypothetical protein B0H17DRAFT_1063674 [Mycena rosella]|uniref:Uncharacterized protein n=1 Tax=Mycena rosella TaxID=1033263 RepID=A0AAD7DH82_MYCRO|nr:hypothetical protein B0H17DRAFT_1063674 [Mycena rosella]
MNAHPAPRALRLGAHNPRDAPPRKARLFSECTLALKGGKKKTWSGMPANLGVMRRAVHGPAVGFVRNPAV